MFLVLIMFIVGLSSCQQKSEEWLLIDAKGFEEKNQSFNDLLFISDKIGFIVGEEKKVTRLKDGNLKVSKTSLLYKTNNGGNNWVKSSFGKGWLKSIVWNQKDIYIIRVVSEDNEVIGRNIIYRSTDLGASWKEVAEFPSMIGRIVFSTNGTGLIVKMDKLKKSKIYLTNDSGESWTKRENKYPVYGEPVFENNHIWYYTVSDTINPNEKDILVKFDLLEGKTVAVEKLPKGFNAYKMSASGSDLWFIGREGEGVNLYKRTSSEDYQLVNRFYSGGRLFPKVIHVVGKEIFVIIGERKDGYVENHSFRSYDEGQTWVEETLADPLYISPICFYDKPEQGTFLTWIYSGSGQMQVPFNQSKNR